MVWQSLTQVTRVPHADRDAIWSRVCGFSSLRSEPAVCCFHADGVCEYSATCSFSHDVSRLPTTGCSYARECKVNHPVASRLSLAKSVSAQSIDRGLMRKAVDAPEDEALYVECIGDDFDDTDALWEAVACAMLENGECIGASDLPAASRQRLVEAGLYKIVDDEMIDEWLCVPASLLRDRLVPPATAGLLELVKRAASSGEYVLVHHAVSWCGSDADFEDPLEKKKRLKGLAFVRKEVQVA